MSVNLSVWFIIASFLGVVNSQLFGFNLLNRPDVPRIQPVSFTLPPRPSLTGRLAVNNILTRAEKVHENLINGPSAFVNHNGSLYAGTIDNKLYNVATCPPKLIADLSPKGCSGTKNCGQMVSLRLHPPTGLLLALDTYRGLYAINPADGQSKLIFPTSTKVNGKAPVYLNDMVVTSSGLVIMSDSSDAYHFEYTLYICLDGRPTGRLIVFMPNTGQSSELLPGKFNLPNGLEFTPDGDLLVTETCRAAVHRISFKRNSFLKVTPFATNLPGLPDNIRASGRGTYWVPMSFPRNAGISSPLDETSRNPYYRLMGFYRLSIKDFENMYKKTGLLIELDSSGNILGSLHDPTGNTLTMITEVNEFDGVLSIGSHLVPYMTRIVLPPMPGSPPRIEGVIQLMRSRCQLPDSEVEAARRRLKEGKSAKVTDNSTSVSPSPPK